MPPSKTIAQSGRLGSGGKLIVDFIDTGQGNAVLVSFPNGDFLLVDCGSQATSTRGWPFTHVRDYIANVTGGNAITAVVLSHGDDDHTAFVPYIPEAANPTYVHYGGTPSDYSPAVRDWIASHEGRKDRFVFRYPANYANIDPDADMGSATTAGNVWVSTIAANFGKSPNSKSIVLMIRWKDHMVILPGDAETDTEAFIMSKVPTKILKDCTVLMPGHHGAYEATSTEWIDVLAPEIDAISASGTNLSYAHPDCTTLDMVEKAALGDAKAHDVICSGGRGQRYKRHSTTDCVLVTATNGDVRFISDGSNWRLLASSLGAEVPLPEAPDPLLAGLVANAPWNRSAPPVVPERPVVEAAPARPVLARVGVSAGRP